jgi:hypothetical protein
MTKADRFFTIFRRRSAFPIGLHPIHGADRQRGLESAPGTWNIADTWRLHDPTSR